MKLSISLAGVNWCSSAGITRGNSRSTTYKTKKSRNYIYLQDFKYKLNVTLILIEDLCTICTLLYRILWQILLLFTIQNRLPI
jgi:hypothetical protein